MNLQEFKALNLSMPGKILAGTGHRPDKLGGYTLPNPTYDLVKSRTVEAIREIKPEWGISGMALGFDSLLAQVFIDERIPFIAAVPFLGQDKKWPSESRRKYSDLLAKAFLIVEISSPGYAAWKMQVRNKWMVDMCHVLLACWNGSSGGTANCIEYAKSVNRNISYVSAEER